MKDYHPIPPRYFADPKVPEGTADTKELKILRSLRTSMEQLWTCARSGMECASFLEHSLYPAGSSVGEKRLTAEKKKAHQSRIPLALENLAKIENGLVKLS